ncbi:DUF1376 domain-containing protein [Tardiphaga sp. 862_B3_N1_1]|uniref:DUF1376 domain-containing protein n=1 Tax=Tardiphaga sp. 862_B3_N1_1 TaxID=3240763 RepID=UPI003F8C3F4C
MSRPWMPLWISDYLGDTQHLSTLEHGAYLLLIMQYWQKEGLPDDDAQLMRIARLTPDEWSNARPMLQALFKQGWKHPRIDAELQLSDEKYEKRSKAGKEGGKASALARRRAKFASAEALVQQSSSNASTNDTSNASSNNAAKFNQPQPHPPIVSVPSERAPPAPPDPEKELFDRGKQVLGKKAGGLIAKLKAAKGGNIALARAAIEQASTKQDPAEYIAAAIRGGAGPPAFTGGRPNGGFTQFLIDQHEEQSHGPITIDHDDSELAKH